MEVRRKTDPKIQAEGFGKVRAPVGTERDASREPTDDLIHKKSECARTVSRSPHGVLKRNLILDCPDNAFVVQNGEILSVQGSEPGTVGEHLPDGDL